jgi:phosphoribosyl-ATP pyrophosphohydrolase
MLDQYAGKRPYEGYPKALQAGIDAITALRSAPHVGARVKPLAAVFDAAQAEAEKAMRKFPQPNYVISKVAEEAGEVVKAAIHCAENRETKEAVLGEVVQCMAMLIRLCLEGDQVHGLAALLPAGEGE